MRDSDLKWYFPKAKNVSGRGENDPQKELFPGDVYQTMIRESIQNSLDHHDSNSYDPVRVEYKLRKMNTSEFPYLKNDLKEHIQLCFDISKADKFKRMLDVLGTNQFYTLEVADYHTIGMDYDYDQDKGRFKKFVRYTGDPNEKSGAGGSHGYGKITYFSVSEINTIIVSSLTLDGVLTFEGVSRLATHPTDEPRCSYYDTGFLDKGDGIPVQCKEDDDNSIIPTVFYRRRKGTSVYIPFVNINDSTKDRIFKTCCEAVLRNFFAAINDGKLDVLIDFSEGELIADNYLFECTKDNIEEIFSLRFFNNPPYDRVRRNVFDRFNPHPYWLAYRNVGIEVIITDKTTKEEALELCAGKKYICFRKELPIIGNTSLYVNVDIENGNDLILYMRCPLMVVGVLQNNSNRGYSAVFVCDDEREGKGNELLRNMEDAAHRTWSKRQLKFDKRPQEKIDQAGRIEDEMKEFINWCLSVVFPANQADSEDVELEDFTVPLISDSNTTNPLIGSLINIPGNDDEIKGAPVDIHIDAPIPTKKSSFIGKAQVTLPKKVEKVDKETTTYGGGGLKNHKTPDPNPNPKPTGDKNFEEQPEGEERIVRVKFPVKYRIFADEEGDGGTLYTLIIHSPQQEEKAYIVLTPVGEIDDKSCNVHIQSASVGKTHENEIAEVPLIEGKNVITFRVDNAGEYAFSLLAEHYVTVKE